LLKAMPKQGRTGVIVASFGAPFTKLRSTQFILTLVTRPLNNSRKK
jgi:hypothetical protein